MDACYDRGAPFLSEVPPFGSSRPLPKIDSKKGKKILKDEKFHG